MYLHDTLNCTIELSNIFKNSKFSLISLISYGIDLQNMVLPLRRKVSNQQIQILKSSLEQLYALLFGQNSNSSIFKSENSD